MADYKILQNIDLAQNEIKEVSKIANDRQDGQDKGLLIQTGNNTSLTFNRKIGDTANFIKGTVKDGTEESTLDIKPSKVVISNTNTKGTTTSSNFVLGLEKGNEYIEAVSPSIDIKTGGTDYTDPHISLKKEGSTLGLQSNTVKINSKVTTESSLTMDGGITGISNDISLKDSSENVSLHLNTKGTIVEEANTSITETVGTRSVALNTKNIEIKDSTTSSTPSIIEVNNTGIKASKGLDSSYVDIQSSSIQEKSNNVTIQTSKATLNLNETQESASLTSTEGTITLNSLNVEIKATKAINVGSNGDTTTTTLKSNKTKIISPTIEIGTESPSTSVSIGKTSSDVTLTGRSNFLIEAKDTDSKVQANDLKFNTSLSSNDIKVYWDSTLNSLVFAKA